MRKCKGYWTFDKVKEEALKFTNRGDFQKKSVSAYLKSYKNGWLNEVCSHMIDVYKPDGYWNYENIKEEALKFNDRSSFKKGSKAYSAACISYKQFYIIICYHFKYRLPFKMDTLILFVHI